MHRQNSKRKTLCCKKKTIYIWDNIDNRVFSRLVKTQTNYKHLIKYLDKVIRPLVLIMSKISGSIKIFKVKGKKIKMETIN